MCYISSHESADKASLSVVGRKKKKNQVERGALGDNLKLYKNQTKRPKRSRRFQEVLINGFYLGHYFLDVPIVRTMIEFLTSSPLLFYNFHAKKIPHYYSSDYKLCLEPFCYLYFSSGSSVFVMSQRALLAISPLTGQWWHPEQVCVVSPETSWSNKPSV